MTIEVNERNTVVFIPVTEEFDQVREIKDIFPKEEFHRKGLKDIDTFFARREGEEHINRVSTIYFLPVFH